MVDEIEIFYYLFHLSPFHISNSVPSSSYEMEENDMVDRETEMNIYHHLPSSNLVRALVDCIS